jgi:hypothetical protein
MSAYHSHGAPTTQDRHWRCTRCQKSLGIERRHGPGRTGDQDIHITEDNRVLCVRCYHREQDEAQQPQQLRLPL